MVTAVTAELDGACVNTGAMLIPIESKGTSTRRGCKGELADSSIPVWVCFGRRTPVEIPTCRSAISLNGGEFTCGGERGGGVTSPPLHPHPWIQVRWGYPHPLPLCF
jgi:hypothetical protein